MHRRRVRHVLCESKRFESTHATRKEKLPIIAEDDNVGWDLVEHKETLQKRGTLAGIDAGLVLLGSNIDDAFRIDAKACESVHEFVLLLDPGLAPDTIESELSIEREEHGRCTVYNVGPDNGGDAVRELSDCGTRFWLSATSRRVSHAPIGACPVNVKSMLARSPLRSPVRCCSLFHSNIIFVSTSTFTVKPLVFSCETFELKPRACR